MGRRTPPPPDEFRLTRAEQEKAVAAWDALAWRQARRWHRYAGGDVEDYYRSAVAGLWEAATRFDTRRGVTFSTFALDWVDLHCRRLAKQEAAKGGRHPGSRNTIVLAGPLRFDEVSDTSGGESGHDHLASAGGWLRDHRDDGAAAERTDLAVDLWAAVASLPARSRAAVELRFRERLSLKAVGVRLGVSSEVARATIERAVGVLRVKFPGLAAYAPDEVAEDE